MTHSLSLSAAESPPAMYRKAALAMLMSSTSMNVAIVTATAITQGLTARFGGGSSGVAVGAVIQSPIPRLD
jgi:hypothetical protein